MEYHANQVILQSGQFFPFGDVAQNPLQAFDFIYPDGMDVHFNRDFFAVYGVQL